MKAIEQVLKEESMFDKIGVYYDSRERRLECSKQQTEIKGSVYIESFERLKPKVVLEATKGEETLRRPLDGGYYYEGDKNDLVTMAQSLDRDFLTLKDEDSAYYTRYSHTRSVLKFDVKVTAIAEYQGGASQIIELEADRATGFDAQRIGDLIFSKGADGRVLFSPTVKFTAIIERKTDEESVKELKASFLQQRGGLQPKEYFAKMCDPSVSQTETQWHRRKKFPAFRGEVKKLIFRLEKTTQIFLLEYLYGLRVNKTAKTEEIYNALRSTGYSDFGIRDVAKLALLFGVLNRYPRSLSALANELTKLGLKPVKSLDRWKELKQIGDPGAA